MMFPRKSGKKLPQFFLCSCIFGYETVTGDIYFDSFMVYVSKTKAQLMDRILSDSVTIDHEEVVDFLLEFECKRLVTKKNFRLPIKELEQKPRLDVSYP